MRITVTHDDGTTADITEGVSLFLNQTPWSRVDYLTAYQTEFAVAALQAIGTEDATDAAEALEAAREAELEAQRRRDAFYRTQAERQEAERQAAAQLAAEMREREPKLAAWNDAALVRLHQMRNSGLA